MYTRNFTARWKNQPPEVIFQQSGYSGQEDSFVSSDSVNTIFKDFNHDDPNDLLLIVNGLPQNYSYIHEVGRLYFYAPADSNGTINLSVTASDEFELETTTDQFSVTWNPVNDS
jgi:hypothetical protein